MFSIFIVWSRISYIQPRLSKSSYTDLFQSANFRFWPQPIRNQNKISSSNIFIRRLYLVYQWNQYKDIAWNIKRYSADMSLLLFWFCWNILNESYSMTHLVLFNSPSTFSKTVSGNVSKSKNDVNWKYGSWILDSDWSKAYVKIFFEKSSY